MSPFWQFYFGAYQGERRHAGTVALCLAGTVAGLALPLAAWAVSVPWLALLSPLVHGMPGLVGHRLFERSTAVGDVRITRKNHPIRWCIAANHLLQLDTIRAALMLRPRAAITFASRGRRTTRP